MILVDANLLLYAYDSASARHRVAARWLEGVLSGSEAVGFAWVSLLAFLRIGTNPRAFSRPLSVSEAIACVSSWLEQPVARVVEPGERHWAILQRLLADAKAKGPLVMDAGLAALALEHGATLCTCDADFSRFPGLKLEDPLRSS